MAGVAPSPYRQLQRRCKAAGLRANLSAAELTRLLTEHEMEQAAATGTTPHAADANAGEDGAETDPVCRLWPDGFAGISAKGIFNALPNWVDSSKAPGTTSQVSGPSGATTQPLTERDRTVSGLSGRYHPLTFHHCHHRSCRH